jgi:hypothetical protein
MLDHLCAGEEEVSETMALIPCVQRHWPRESFTTKNPENLTIDDTDPEPGSLVKSGNWEIESSTALLSGFQRFHIWIGGFQTAWLNGCELHTVGHSMAMERGRHPRIIGFHS